MSPGGFPRPSLGFEAPEPAPEQARSPWWGDDVQARAPDEISPAAAAWWDEADAPDPDTLEIPAASVVPSDSPANVQQRTPTGTVGRLMIGGAVASIVGIGLLGTAVAVLQAPSSVSSDAAQHITHPQGSFWWIEETPTTQASVSASPSATPSPTPARSKTVPPTHIATRGPMDAVQQTPRPTLIKPTPTPTTPTPKLTTVPKPAKSTPTPTVDLSGSTGLNAAVPAIRAIVNAVETAWPAAGPYYGVRADPYPDHPSGHAVDVMLPVAGRHVLGQAIADHLQANAATYGVDYIIFEQRVWSVARAAEGWRLMEDRGTSTANHMDHVHVTVN